MPRFVVVEGPNGAGKTTTARVLAERLRATGRTHETTETTRTPFGNMVRAQEKWLAGRPLALAVAADRYAHLDNEIQPRLRAGSHVVSDRYVPSSLVLQRIDGLTVEEIWSYNLHTTPPDLTVYLEEDPETIRQRLAARTTLSRLEKTGSPELELELYHDARAFLGARGWRQIVIDCRGLSPEAVADRIHQHLPF
ncbi:dTMP kinase [Actinorugispora endophytica]|uniref:Thymidylate kinase n=1 Tax=Actinorugispora endophytica TaxID=1605990 RepID=A0A4R6V385_9ACTN|nr:dTMP kinase [Actinorugispora endophytica]TDQ53123.1 thymidylate kinase [Actinorugispora endophytica]